MDGAAEFAVCDFALEFLYLVLAPHGRFAAGVVHQMITGEAFEQALRQLPLGQCGVFVGADPQVVAAQ